PHAGSVACRVHGLPNLLMHSIELNNHGLTVDPRVEQPIQGCAPRKRDAHARSAYVGMPNGHCSPGQMVMRRQVFTKLGVAGSATLFVDDVVVRLMMSRTTRHACSKVWM